MELWNEARGIPRYDVSSWGQVFDKQKFRLLKQSPDKAGYLRVKLWIAGERKTVSVHRLAVDRYLGVSPGSVSKTLRGLQPTCKGYTFERIGGEAHDSR
nr:MAG TPA: PROTEIN/DNA Complex catalytic motif, Helix-turn-helix DNA [Caudoviricetes sp.]